MKLSTKIFLSIILISALLILLVGCFPTINKVPIITSTPITLAEVDGLYTYDVNATDPDGDTLTYSLDVKPDGMTIVSATGVISWTPTTAQIGDNPVTVKVSDGALDITQNFTIVVSEAAEPGYVPTPEPEPEPSPGGGGGGGGAPAPPPVNHAPTITSTPITTATVGEEYTYDVDATDPEGDTLYYYLKVSPTGMTIVESTGLISWIPTGAHIGDNAVVVEVSDLELSVTKGFTIIIPGSLCGTVISDAAGPAVGGSTVEVKDGGGTTTTDAQGRFGIADLADGTYDIIVTQSGRATSKAQDVHIISSQTTVVNLVQKKVNVPAWETDPPTISTTGIVEGATLSGTETCSVQIVDDSDIKCIYVGFGYIPGELEYNFASYDSDEIAPTPFDTISIPDGEFQIVIVTYDMNYNRSQLTLNVTIDNSVTDGNPPGTPVYLWPVSVTLGEKIGFFSTGRNELFKRIGIKEDPNIINLPEGKEIDLNAVINVADSDSNLFVVIEWDSVAGATGYRIYRKFEGEDIYYCIGSTEYTGFYDTGPRLSVGRKTYYQVSAFNGFGESEKTSPEWTVPLPKFNLNLVSPKNGATGVSLNPTLQWQPAEIVGEYQYYNFYVMGKNDSYYTWYGGVENETSVTYNGEPLQYLKVYEWNVDFAVAYDDFYSTGPEFRAVSIAGDYNIALAEPGGGSLNGAFEFTTQSE